MYPVDFVEHFFESRNRISLEDANFIIQKYKNGSSLRDISILVGRSKNKVRAELLKHGIKLRESLAHATHKRKIKHGKQGVKPYYGFCYFEGQIVKDPREYSILQYIHKLWVQKKTIHQINQALDHAGFPSRMGKKWSWAALQNIIARFKKKQIVSTTGGQLEIR